MYGSRNVFDTVSVRLSYCSVVILFVALEAVMPIHMRLLVEVIDITLLIFRTENEIVESLP